MEIKKLAQIKGCQDGAIYGSELFRLNHYGQCAVYDLKSLGEEDVGVLEPIGEFTLDRADVILPHGNWMNGQLKKMMTRRDK